MIVKLLGLVDLLTAIAAVFVHIGFLPTGILKFFILYLLIKGVIFIKSFTSILDLACAAYLTLMFFFGIKTFFVYIIAVYLFQKAVVSIAS
jgi:hypothetical protein